MIIRSREPAFRYIFCFAALRKRMPLQSGLAVSSSPAKQCTRSSAASITIGLAIFTRNDFLNMTILNSTRDDIPEIFRLYQLATEYQKKTFPDNLWPEFDRELIETEVAENHQFKLMIDGKIACVWAITFNDEIIWPEDDGVSSVYIHRIATNPDFRGNDLVKKIAEWAKEYATSLGKKYVRLDTCGDNTRLINHYQKCGFEFLGLKHLHDSAGLPPHYEDADVCYFEIKLDNA